MGVVGAIGLGLSAIGQGVGFMGAMGQEKAQRKAESAQAAGQAIQAQRERYKQIRDARAKSAMILQAGVNQGAAGSSSVQSGAAGVNQEAFGNIGQGCISALG